MKNNQSPVVPVKMNYTIKLEALAPITLTYTISAESEQQALEMMERMILSPVTISRPKIAALKKLKAIVYQYGTTILKATKNYIK